MTLLLVNACSVTANHNDYSSAEDADPSLNVLLERLVTKYYSFGVGAIDYNNTNKMWPKSREILLTHTLSMFPDTDFSNISLIDTKVIDATTFQVLTKISSNNDQADTETIDMMLTARHGPHSIDLKLINGVSLNDATHNATNTQHIIFGTMLALAFQSKYGANTPLMLDMNPSSRDAVKAKKVQFAKDRIKQKLKQQIE